MAHIYTHGIANDESHCAVWTAWIISLLGLGQLTYVRTDAHLGSPFEVRRRSYSGIGLLPLW